MKILGKYNASMRKIMGFQRFCKDEIYKESPYLIKESLSGEVAVFNCFTREAILMTDKEYSEQFNAENESLINRWYFIPERWDALTWQESFERIYRNMRKKNRLIGLTDYIILPTLGCNARCPYCFQCDDKKTVMTEETADAVIEYIWKTFFGKITLRWFGGEPLTNAPIITKICESLMKRNVNYESTITTNGLLFNQSDAEVINDVWRLKMAQITFDGTENYYNSIKRWKNPDGHEFERVLNNVEFLISNDIAVDVRLNVSKENEKELAGLIDIFRYRFQNADNVTIYPHVLFGQYGENPVVYTDNDYEELYSICKRLYAKIADCGLSKDSSYSEISQWNCMADNFSSVCISPNGSLTLCESFTDDTEHVIGTIYDAHSLDQAEINRWQERYHCDMCAECKLRPFCTKLRQCPVQGSCNASEVDYKEWQIRQFLRKASGQ